MQAPGTENSIQAVVADAEAARTELLNRGVEATEVETLAWGSFSRRSPTPTAIPGPCSSSHLPARTTPPNKLESRLPFDVTQGAVKITRRWPVGKQARRDHPALLHQATDRTAAAPPFGVVVSRTGRAAAARELRAVPGLTRRAACADVGRLGTLERKVRRVLRRPHARKSCSRSYVPSIRHREKEVDE